MTGMSRRLSGQRPMPAWQRVVVGVVTGLLAGAATLVIGGHASADTSPAPSSPTSSPPGTVAGVPATSSEVTVSGRGEFSKMKFTVSQTQNIVNQAVGISWTGGAPTATGFEGEIFTNFLQIMECWGNPVTDDSTPADAANDIPANPGPPREQCEFGASVDLGDIHPSSAGVSHLMNGLSDNRTVFSSPTESQSGQYDDVYGTAGEVPFRAVDGTVIPHDIDLKSGSNDWVNPYYDITTSNEIPVNYTWPDGTGSAVFEADTQLEASGLGCGADVPGTSTPPDCWLVIVPRGATSVSGQPLQSGPLTLDSPLDSVNWQNRIAIQLHYLPVASPCPIGAVEHPTEGSELVTAAMTSWQSKICATSGNVLGYNALNDDEIRQELTSSAAGGGELGFLSRPVDPSTVPAGEQLVYAPVALSGVTISFEVDDVTAGPGPPVTQINLTPRLVAKLLTDSYQAANQDRLGGEDVPGVGTIQGIGTPPASDYAWLAKNAEDLFTDPEFQQANPQLAGLHAASPGVEGGTVMVELNGSDAAYELWSWILANPAAKAFLEGQPDPWGMTVDPYFSISPKVNTTGAGLSLPATTFPSADPWSGFTGSTVAPSAASGQPPLAMTDIDPDIDSMSDVALDVLQDNNTAKTLWNAGGATGGALSYSNPWALTPPGNRSILGVTTTDSADKYGVIDASLENAAGNFVAPDTSGLLAGEAAMQPSEVPGVLAPDVTSTSPSAYPLSMLTYAAVPLGTVSKADCTAYAALLNYAAGPGQVSGDALGDLPPGYAPLPSQLTAQTQAAAAQVAACPQAPGTGSGAGSSTLSLGTSSAGSGSGTAASPGAAAAASGAPAPGAIPAGGPAGMSQSVQLTGGTTPANPGVFGYALPVGAATGLLAGLGAPLLGRRRQLLSALRLPALPHPARFPGGLPRQRRWPPAGRPRRPWGRGRGSP